MDVCLYHFMSAWAALLKDNSADMIFHGESALTMAVEAGTVHWEERCHLILAQMLHRRGERDAAWNHLTQTRRSIERRDDRLTEFICDLTETEFYLNESKQRQALAALKRTMRLGAENDYVNFYGWQPKMMTRLCALALEFDMETDYVQKLVRERRLLPTDNALECERWPWLVKVYTLGRFSIAKDNNPLMFRGKTQTKPLELLKALIAFGGCDVSENRLIEALWPDTEGDAAHQALHTTLHRLRKLIGIDKIVIVQSHKLTLNRQYCWVDIWIMERILERIIAALKNPSLDSQEELPRWADQLLELYRGAFLRSDTDRAWVISPQERIHGKFQRTLAALGLHWERTGQWEHLAAAYQKAIDSDDLTEEIYRRLIHAYRQLDRHTEAVSVSTRCQRVLNVAHGSNSYRDDGKGNQVLQ
jgi:DNA-binding SARP family transcriptional activator